jgi:hypothetical protein
VDGWRRLERLAYRETDQFGFKAVHQRFTEG